MQEKVKKFGKGNNMHNRHFYARVNEHLFWDKNYHIFKHLSLSKHCQDNCNVSCLEFIEKATSSFYQLKNRESFHIEQMKLAKLNKQVDHVGLALHFSNLPLCQLQYVFYNIVGL